MNKDLTELYQQVIDAMEDGIWDWDVPTGKAYFTPRYYELLGFKDQEFEATYDNWFKLVHPDDITRVETELKAGVASGRTFSIDLRLKKKDSEFSWFNTRGRTIEKSKDSAAKRMVGIFSDITERKQIEQELEISKRDLQSKLEESRKLNELTVDRELKMVELKKQLEECRKSQKN